MNDYDKKPVIGITSYLEQAQTGVWDVRASFLPEVYIKAVTEAGGTVVVLPPQPLDEAAATKVLNGLDGLILAGGADIDPALYGQEAAPETGAPRQDRDSFELALTRAALKTELPFFGICRGAQLLNVALGGTLIQHLPDVVGDKRYQPAPATFTKMRLDVLEDTKIAEMLGDETSLDAHLYHHQAIDRVADSLAVTSTTADGIIEAVELPGHPFCVAVQWHPEENTEDRRLFKGFIAAAKEFQEHKKATT